MGKIYFIADTHFGDDRIRRYEERPFQTVEQMDREMIAHWNDIVALDDDVYVIGDFCAETVDPGAYLKQLNGRIYLIKGNHDIKPNQHYRFYGFKEVYDHSIIINNFWILSHEPMYINTNMPYANIFGHVHGSPMFKDYSSQHFCVSVERIHYMPICFDEIKMKIQEAENE